MRFEKYIDEGFSWGVEDVSYDSEKESKPRGERRTVTNLEIMNKCRPFLKLIKGLGPLWRGAKNEGMGGIKSIRKDRKPGGLITGPEFMELNSWLKSAGHVRRDECVITTASKESASDFIMGSKRIYAIFPIGKFNYTWVESNDFNDGWVTLVKGGEWNVQDLSADLEQPNYRFLNKKYGKHLHTNKGFSTAYKKQYEIWFDCKKYYYVDEIYKQEMSDLW